jgi:hypothetical protein
MYTCYSLCTNEVLNLGLSNFNHPTRLLHSKGVSQLNKWARELPWTSGLSIYTPSFKTQRLEANSANFRVIRHAGQGDQMLRSVIIIAVSEVAIDIDRTLSCVRSTPTGRVQSAKSLFGCSLMLTELWLPSIRSSVWSLSDISADQINWSNSLATSSHNQTSIRSVIWPSIHFQFKILCLWSWLQLILGLFLSYLVLGLTSVHNT